MEITPITQEQVSDPNERMYAIYTQVSESMKHENGYNGPVRCTARVNGWNLQITSSDFGDLMISASKQDEKIYKAFEYKPDGTWYPLTTNTQPNDFMSLLEIAEHAEWTHERTV